MTEDSSRKIKPTGSNRKFLEAIVFFKINRLGDNLVSLPAVQALRKVLPEAPLHIYTDPIAREFYEHELGEIRSIPLAEFRVLHRRPVLLAREIRDLRKLRPAAVVLPGDQASVANLLTWAVPFARVIGRQQVSQKIPPRLTRCLDAAESEPMAYLDWQLVLALLEDMKVTHDLPDTPPPPDLSHLLQNTQRIGKHVVIHPGGSLPVKRWFPERFAELALRLAEDYSVTWIRHGDDPGPPVHDQIQPASPQKIGELTRVLGSASLFVGNNSGPMNIAAAIGTPSIILCGPSTQRWDPVWHREKIHLLRHPDLACLPCDQEEAPALTCANLHDPMACMKYWSVDKILALSRKTLADDNPVTVNSSGSV